MSPVQQVDLQWEKEGRSGGTVLQFLLSFGRMIASSSEVWKKQTFDGCFEIPRLRIKGYSDGTDCCK